MQQSLNLDTLTETDLKYFCTKTNHVQSIFLISVITIEYINNLYDNIFACSLLQEHNEVHVKFAFSHL